MFLAEEVREIMAQMGFKKFEQMVGRRDHLGVEPVIEHWKARNIDLSKILHAVYAPPGVAISHCEEQDHGLDKALDHILINEAKPALEKGKPVVVNMPIKNTNRTVGSMLSGKVAKKYGHEGLPEDTIQLNFSGSAGQSLGAFLAKGVTVTVEGGANDYVGKGLSGGKIKVFPPKSGNFAPEQNIIVGNTVLYGATGGECYFRGIAGERFAVRNSGAVAVVEGVGDHGCEYMTGGVVVVLGATGRNFAAGMSGGIAYVLNETGDFEERCNKAMVELETIARCEGNSALTDDQFAEMLQHDELRLKMLISKHLENTGSSRAAQILDLWDRFLPLFTKVMPTDYRRALLDLRTRKPENEGLHVEAIAGE